MALPVSQCRSAADFAAHYREVSARLAKPAALIALAASTLVAPVLEVEKPQSSYVPKRPTIAKIQAVVARDYDVFISAFATSGRNEHLMEAKHVAEYLSRKIAKRSLQDIGTRFGGLSHAAVMRGCRKIELLIASNAEFSARIARLSAEILKD